MAGCGIKLKFIGDQNRARLKRLSGEAFWVGAGQCAAAIGGLIGVRLMTSLLTPEVYGRLALAMTAVMLIVQILFQPLSNGCTRFFSFACDDGSSGSFLAVLRSRFLKTLLLIGGLAGLFFCMRPAWGGGHLGLILCAVVFAGVVWAGLILSAIYLLGILTHIERVSGIAQAMSLAKLVK